MRFKQTMWVAAMAALVLVAASASAGTQDCAALSEELNRSAADWNRAAKDLMPDVVEHSATNTRVLELHMEAMAARMEAVNAGDSSTRAEAEDRYDKLYSTLSELKPESPTRNYQTGWDQVMADKDDLHKGIDEFLTGCQPSDSRGTGK